MSQNGQELVYLIIVYGIPELARYCSAFLFQTCNQYENHVLSIKGVVMAWRKDAIFLQKLHFVLK